MKYYNNIYFPKAYVIASTTKQFANVSGGCLLFGNGFFKMSPGLLLGANYDSETFPYCVFYPLFQWKIFSKHTIIATIIALSV